MTDTSGESEKKSAKTAAAKKAAPNKKPTAKKTVSRKKKPVSKTGARKPTPHADEFLEHLMGGPLIFTSAEVAQQAGVSEEMMVRLWRAMGFADVGDEAVFTKTDVEALKSIMRLVNMHLLSFEDAVEITRSIGQTTARLTEWQTNTLGRSMVERGVITTSGILPEGEIPELYRQSKTFKPVLERLLIYAWRRQMVANVTRSAVMAASGDNIDDQMTVGFADLVGFTNLSRQIPDNELAKLVEAFETESADIVASTGARLVKTLGDEVLFVDHSAQTVAETALRLQELRTKVDQLPPLRIGLASGSVLERMGDVFGTTVNRASRITAMASPEKTFIDSATMDSLAGSKKYALKAVRPRPARGFGFGLMRVWALTRGK